MNQRTFLSAVRAGKYQLRTAGFRHDHFTGAVYVAVRMTGDGDRLFPGTHSIQELHLLFPTS